MNTRRDVSRAIYAYAVALTLLVADSAYADTPPALQTLLAGDTEQRGFGWDVALDGRWTFVVAPGSGSGDQPYRQGAVYVFERNPKRMWREQQKLLPPLGPEARYAAGSVAISGRTAVIGGAELGHFFQDNRGVVDVYTLGAKRLWEHQTRIPSPPTAVYNGFGIAVAMWRERLIVGAREEDDATGAAYVYIRNQHDEWILDARLTAPAGAPIDNFGQSVAIHGDMALVGAPAADGRGAVFVYVRIGTGVWELRQKLQADAAEPRPVFVGSIDLSSDGELLLVGALGEEQSRGAAYVYRRKSADSWAMSQRLTANEQPDGQFGISVSVERRAILVGANYALLGSRGAAYLFTPESRNRWKLESTLTSPIPYDVDEFGSSVAVGANAGIVGAYALNDFKGAAFAFSLLSHRSGVSDSS